jgi:hypothetical protein
MSTAKQMQKLFNRYTEIRIDSKRSELWRWMRDMKIGAAKINNFLGNGENLRR